MLLNQSFIFDIEISNTLLYMNQQMVNVRNVLLKHTGIILQR